VAGWGCSPVDRMPPNLQLSDNLIDLMKDGPRRLDCLAGHVGLELRNVVANYPFESSRGFPGSEPNCGHGDHSRLSCSAGMRSSGLGSAGVFSKRSARTLAITRRRREGTNWPRSLSIRRWSGGGKASNTIAQFALDFPRKESVCGDHGPCPELENSQGLNRSLQ
jgi:hypothetical protein